MLFPSNIGYCPAKTTSMLRANYTVLAFAVVFLYSTTISRQCAGGKILYAEMCTEVPISCGARGGLGGYSPRRTMLVPVGR